MQLMKGLPALIFCLGLISACSPTSPPVPAPSTKDPAPLTYSTHIRPLFARACLECHGLESTESGLDLRSVSAMLTGGESGPALVPGNPDESLLYELIHDEQMPPDGDPLTSAERKLVAAWIKAGARP